MVTCDFCGTVYPNIMLEEGEEEYVCDVCQKIFDAISEEYEIDEIDDWVANDWIHNTHCVHCEKDGKCDFAYSQNAACPKVRENYGGGTSELVEGLKQLENEGIA